MFTQDQLFKAVAPRPPVVVFVDYEILRSEIPPDGALVNNVSQNGGEITIVVYL